MRGLRWPKGFRCPACRHREGHEVVGGRFWACSSPGCRYRTCIRVDTFLEGSRKPIRLWLMALYAFLKAEQGITAVELRDHLKNRISAPTAWEWLRRFRLALRQDQALSRSLLPLRRETRQQAAAWAGAPSTRSAISWLQSRQLPPRKLNPFVDWLLVTYAGRVSSKHLDEYWLEFQFRTAAPPASYTERFFWCLRRLGERRSSSRRQRPACVGRRFSRPPATESLATRSSLSSTSRISPGPRRPGGGT